MLTNNLVSVSVRKLVEFIMRSGSIDSGFMSSSRAQEGIKLHKEIQKSSGENYISEVTVSYMVDEGDISLEVKGRIDGVIVESDEITINEIKTVSRDIDSIDENYDEQHWAQAKCYGYMYGYDKHFDVINIRLTYCSTIDGNVKNIDRKYKIDELREFFQGLVIEYVRWLGFLLEHQEKRNETITAVGFPFDTYRKGQRKFAVEVYRSIRDGKRLFVNAPTGIGKTMGVIFPALKAMGELLTSKIFYLTAKTTTRRVAEDTLNILREKGALIKSITLTAKEKICFNINTVCNPNECIYANGHFARVNEALEDVLKNNFISREIIERTAKIYNVCPFELSLDAALFCDVVICDYNYVFDPSAYLKRFFMDGNNDYTLLIDEAHNLPDRAREMFSSEILKSLFLEAKKNLKKDIPEISKAAGDVNNYFIQLRKSMEKAGVYSINNNEIPDNLEDLLKNYINTCDKYFCKYKEVLHEDYSENFFRLYFDIINFLRVCEYYNDKYVTLTERLGNDIRIKLMCIDPSENLKQILDKMKSSIFFSGTLTPINYYKYILGGGDESYGIQIPYPFPKNNLRVILDSSISTRYDDREKSFSKIAYDIKIIAKRKGNYFVFFPSYKYLNEVYNKLVETMENDEFNILIQNTDMTDVERDKFLEDFSKYSDITKIAFVVMGGVFGEGIDIIENRLSGAVIVGVGLPMVSSDREIIRSYFEEKMGNGFEYAYAYPGINRVLQAAGRIIRSERDVGILLLIDDRFLRKPYINLLPEHWMPIKLARNPLDINKALRDTYITH